MDAGTLAQWFTFAAVIFAAYFLTRGGAGSAVSELSKANEILTRRVKELGDEVRDLKVENAALRQRTDFGSVISLHEERALVRHERVLAGLDAQLGVLDLIATRLGPEPPNGT